MTMVALEFDEAFADVNFCALWDPALRPESGPNGDDLYRLVDQARRGDRFAPSEFANTMECTLSPHAWECFQRMHGPRPVPHDRWFYAKLNQFLEVLLHDELTITDTNGQRRKLQPNEAVEKGFTNITGMGPSLHPDELEQALVADDYERCPWLGLVMRILENPTNRLAAVREWLEEQRLAQTQDHSERSRGWTKNQERDQVIRKCLSRGVSPEQICVELDKRTIATLPASQAKGIHGWRNGWEDRKIRNAIQQLFSKVLKRGIVVKPPAISK